LAALIVLLVLIGFVGVPCERLILIASLVVVAVSDQLLRYGDGSGDRDAEGRACRDLLRHRHAFRIGLIMFGVHVRLLSSPR